MESHKAWLCLAAATAVFVALLVWHDDIIGLLIAGTIDLSNLYNAVFGWSSIQTGFLFAVYGFITGKRDGFVGAIAHTLAMQFFNSSLWKAILVGFLLTIFSMPLIAVPVMPTAFDAFYVGISLWFSFFIWAFLLFCLVAYNFGIISRVPDDFETPAH